MCHLCHRSFGFSLPQCLSDEHCQDKGCMAYISIKELFLAFHLAFDTPEAPFCPTCHVCVCPFYFDVALLLGEALRERAFIFPGSPCFKEGCLFCISFSTSSTENDTSAWKKAFHLLSFFWLVFFIFAAPTLTSRNTQFITIL